MKILNIGSLNIDYVYDVQAFARKGQTIASKGRSVFAGGKGLNQSIALGRAGVEAHHAGMVGDEGLFLREILAESGVDVGSVRVLDDCPSGHAVIQRDAEGDNCIILYGGANRRVDAPFVDEALAGFEEGDWLLLQNETGAVAHAIEAAARKGMRVALNPSPITDDLLECPLDLVDCLILNQVEAASLAGVDAAGYVGASSYEELLMAVHGRFERAHIVLTVGEEGSLCWDGERVHACPACMVDAVDTTAAGDTFTGYYLAELLTGSNAATALEVATVASSIAVTREGAAPSIPVRDEVERVMAEAR